MANIVDNREIVIVLRSILKRLEALERESAKQPVRIAGGGGSGVKLTTTAPQSVGIANAVGSGTEAARDDHVHSADHRVNTNKGEWRDGSTWYVHTHFT